MSPTRRTASSCLLAAVALVAALGLGACSRSQHVTDSLTGPSHGGADSFAKGGGGGAPLPPPPVTPPAVPTGSPCVSLTGLGGTVINATADIKQFRATRLRFDITGDATSGAINASGACVLSAAPAVSFISGTANMFLSGTTKSMTATGLPLTFGPLTAPLPVEPGTVLATDAAGNVLQIVWPALAGLPAGPPVLRVNFARWNPGVATGQLMDIRMTFNARNVNGTVATFNVVANGLPVPVKR